MLAYRLTGAGCMLEQVPDPVAGPGEVVVRVAAAGLCHSDLTLAARPPDRHPFALPLVLGHELAGTIVEIGPAVERRDLEVGMTVVGYGPRGCRTCPPCVAGSENYCQRPPADARPLGLGSPGALAEYVAVHAEYVVPTKVDPVQGAALTDAGLTALSALERAHRRAPPGSRGPAVVIGVGGLGHLAVQLARLLGHDEVLAVDVDDVKLSVAAGLGATACVLSSSRVVEDVLDASSGTRPTVVLDFVASDDTLASAAGMVGTGGVISVVGVASGRLSVGMHALPLGASVDLPFWGSRPELDRLLGLAVEGKVRVVTEEVSLDGVPAAYERLRRGEAVGRLVARPAIDLRL